MPELANINILQGLLIPFAGTCLGAACVFFMKKELNQLVQRSLTGFAAGVMVAASIWSLLIPAMEQAAEMGKFAFVPAVAGFWLGILFLLLLDHITPHLHMYSQEQEGPHCSFSKTLMMVFAVIIHNIPEGMAVGVVYASWQSGLSEISLAAATALSIGIAIQNFPEGAIVSMPLKSAGISSSKAFGWGVFSGAVEPVAGLLTIMFSAMIIPFLPYMLSFAAGAMLYVVVEELIPEMSVGSHSDMGTIMFAVGFSLMMTLDVALG